MRRSAERIHFHSALTFTMFRSCRELERERRGLEAQEKKTIADMKKDAKEGEDNSRACAFCRLCRDFRSSFAGKMSLVRIRAKSLITTRNSIQKFYTMGCQLQGLGLRLTSMASTASMTDAMKVASLPPPHGTSHMHTSRLLLRLTSACTGCMFSDVTDEWGDRPAKNATVSMFPGYLHNKVSVLMFFVV